MELDREVRSLSRRELGLPDERRADPTLTTVALAMRLARSSEAGTRVKVDPRGAAVWRAIYLASSVAQPGFTGRLPGCSYATHLAYRT